MPKIKIDGVTYASKNSKNPYGEIASAYAQQARANANTQVKALGQQLAQSKAGAAANYDSAASQAYLNYMKQQNALPEQLSAQGINGGASETALTQLQNNYALQQSQNNASRAAAMAQLQNTYDTNVATLKQQAENEILANNLALAQQQQQYNDTLNQRALERYQATIERFTSTKSVDKAIKRLKKSDPNYTAKKQLLQLRKAQLKEAEKKAKKSGGGGGRRSYGGYSRSYGGYSNSNNSNNNTTSSPKSTAIYNEPAGPSKPTRSQSKTRAGKAYKGSKRSYTYNIKRGGIW